MLDVFAIRTVLCIRGSPVLGSSSAGNVARTSVISLPRSPHPMYTTISASDHLASCCWVTVFPVPNAPGMAAVPPLGNGNIVSRTRCPVMSGMSGISFLPNGRPARTGHFCIIMMSWPATLATVSSTVNSPSRISSTVPLMPGGTMILWVR